MKSELIYDKAAVGERIKAKRRALRLTQEKLAEQVGLAWRSIVDIERGVAGMSIESLLQICSALKTTPNDILLPPTNVDETEMEWMNGALRNASEDARACAIDIVRAYLRGVK